MNKIKLLLWSMVKPTYPSGTSVHANAILENDFEYFLEKIEELNIEKLIDFLLHLNDKGLINNFDFDYEAEAKKFIKL